MTYEPCTPFPDPARLVALRESRLLDSPPEPAFDRLARLAARVLGAPIAIISLVDADRVFFKSSIGLPEPLASQREIPRSRSFCALVAAAGEPFVIADACAHPSLQDDSLIRELGIAAYAGVPLIMPAGYALGALCVVDTEPRAWCADEIVLLQDLAAMVMTEVQLRCDLVEREALQTQLLQSQKIESIGHLAGGIAHDFNNLLTAITGYTDLALRGIPPGSQARNDLEEIQKATNRAAGLTRQLLAFARQQVVEPCVLNLNDLIIDMDKLLRRLVGEDIELLTFVAPDLGHIKADPGQIGQVLVNLAVNARDAMPNGGRLTITTANVTLDQGHVRWHAGVTAGPYVLLSISDTGVGMSAEALAHAFEPFFTTKDVGRGTGLGLATCYGVIQQHGGQIHICSKRGWGTTVEIYLPHVRDSTAAPCELDKADVAPAGTETILLVEDEPAVRALAAYLLRDLGYTVLEATNGEDALRVAQNHSATIDLLLTDMVMPRMGGRALAERLTAARPAIAVLLMSGYSMDAVTPLGMHQIGAASLQKPFLPASLACKVREALDACRA